MGGPLVDSRAPRNREVAIEQIVQRDALHVLEYVVITRKQVLFWRQFRAKNTWGQRNFHAKTLCLQIIQTKVVTQVKWVRLAVAHGQAIMLQAVDYQLRHRLQRPCVSGQHDFAETFMQPFATPPEKSYAVPMEKRAEISRTKAGRSNPAKESANARPWSVFWSHTDRTCSAL